MEDLIIGTLGLALIAVSVVGFVFWIKMLAQSIKRERYGWFVAQLVFGVLASLVFFYAQPSDLRVRS